MHVVMGATGQTGSAVLDVLLSRGVKTRAVVRTGAQADLLRARGAEVAVADAGDKDQLAKAFSGAESVYALNPPAYADSDLFARAAAVHTAIVEAANAARVGELVALSSVGAQHAAGTGNILTTHDFEARLKRCERPLTILRAANFIENWGWSLAPARESGVLPSMFLPLDTKLPMVAARDIGATAAELMLESRAGRHIVELCGPEDYSPNDAAAAFSRLLRRPVMARAVPREEWAGIFDAQGMPSKTVAGFVEMYEGFNCGLTAFEGTHDSRIGSTSLAAALESLVAADGKER